MSELRPLGSEKLQGEDKLRRIMEIANYGRTPQNTITENTTPTNVEFIKESSNGTYGIVREKDGYYVKKGLNEGSLDYIGGIFMKNKNRFSSYADALKRLELISGQESLNEAKKYVLKKSSAPSEPIDAPAPAAAPVEDVPAEPVAEPSPAPVDDVPGPVGDIPSDDMGDVPAEEPMDGEEKDGKRSDYMEEVQKFSGKLGQALRDVKERMESDDIKYVINMVLSAVDLDSLDDEDKEDIAKKFEPEEEGFSDPEFDEIGTGDEEGSMEPEPDEEIDEIMTKLESFVDAPVEESHDEDHVEEKVDLSQFNDLGVEEEVSEEDDVNDEYEIDLEELKGDINKLVDETLSKYFK
jgi:hypothetical protein